MVKLFSNTTVFALEMNGEVDKNHFQQLLEALSPDLQDKISVFKQPGRRQVALFSHLMVRWLFRQNGTPINSPFLYEYGRHGKPYLPNKENLKFNVSHSGRWIVCAIGTDEMGIDIEEEKGLDLNTVSHVLSKQEKAILKATNSEATTSLFYNIWTVKESYFKALGGGLYEKIDMENLNTDFSGQDPRLFSGEKKIEDWNFHQFSIHSNYSLVLCCRSKNIKKEVTFIKIDDIIKDSLSSNN